MKAKREAPAPGGRKPKSPSRKNSRQPAEAKTRRGPSRAAKASAPAREPRTSRSTPQTTPIARPARPKNASQAKARAKARKAKAPKVIRPPLRERVLNRLASIDLRPRTLAAKVPFVVLVIGSLGTGLGVTLWLSTDAAERSYQLGSARQQNQLLQQQKEALERDVLQAQSAPALAEAARGLGMIPTRDTAHLIQDPAGNWVVVGTPKPAQGVPPPPLNTKLPDEKPAPPLAPPVNSAEVPVRVLPGHTTPFLPGAPEPQNLLRAPDGATTLGTEHLPAAPGVQPPPAAPVPDAAVAPAPAPAPAASPPIAEPPVPAPVAVPPAGPPHGVAAPPAGPVIAEQFGPLTVTTPGVPR